MGNPDNPRRVRALIGKRANPHSRMLRFGALAIWIVGGCGVFAGAWAATPAAATQSSTTVFKPFSRAVAPQPIRLVAGQTEHPPAIDGKPDDICWKTAAYATFARDDSHGRPRAGTWFKVGYDQENLYLLLHPNKLKRAKPAPGPDGRDDAALFKGDAVEIFLQPRGPGTAFYQIALNPEGGIYDQAFHPGGKSVGNLKWDAKGIRSTGRRDKTGWFVEAAIPFAALGVERIDIGDKWRANFCRMDPGTRELSAWSPTGGVFAAPEHFGVLEFARQALPRVSKEQHILRGRLLAADNRPAGYVLVRGGNQAVRTGPDGRFELKLEGDHSSDRILSFTSPRYEPLSGQVKIERPVENVAPIHIQPVDPYVPNFAGPIGDGAVAWLRTSIDQPPRMDADRPLPQETQLSLAASPGQYEAAAVAVFVNDPLARPSVQARWFATKEADSGAAVGVRWAERVLRRSGYPKPPAESIFVWRFLRNEPPKSLRKGHLRLLVLTVHVPDDMAAGTYHGELTLNSQGRVVATLPLSLTVNDFHLVEADKRLGLFYRSWNKMFDDPHWSDRELKDIRAHGGSLLVGVGNHAILKRAGKNKIDVDVSRIRQAVTMMRRHGFDPPYLVNLPVGKMANLALGGEVKDNRQYAETTQTREFVQAARSTLQAMDKLQKELNTQPFILWWMDEVFFGDRLPRWLAAARAVRPLTHNPIFVTLTNNPNKNKADVPRKMAAITPYADIRCYNGRGFDQWLAQGHAFKELADELSGSGDQAWVYYNVVDASVTPEQVRLINGYWLWRSPFQVNIPWVYQDPHGSAFDTMDDRRADLGYAFRDAARNELVGTLNWEAYREGYNDLRYLATLQWAIDQAPDSPQADDARQWLDHLRRTGKENTAEWAAQLDDHDYSQRRRQISEMIKMLLKSR